MLPAPACCGLGEKGWLRATLLNCVARPAVQLQRETTSTACNVILELFCFLGRGRAMFRVEDLVVSFRAFPRNAWTCMARTDPPGSTGPTVATAA